MRKDASLCSNPSEGSDMKKFSYQIIFCSKIAMFDHYVLFGQFMSESEAGSMNRRVEGTGRWTFSLKSLRLTAMVNYAALGHQRRDTELGQGQGRAQPTKLAR
jgi:hypothetical protein